jgi:tetratricopeptide (TPR) repeat protein
MNSRFLELLQDQKKRQLDSGRTTAKSPAKPSSVERQPELLKSDSYLRAWASQKAQQGNYAEAIALLNQLLNRNPQNAIDYNNRGLVYFQAGQLDRAIADYDKALAINPRLAKAYNNRANYYAACGDLEAAIADYDQALDLNPSYVRAWLNRGITLRDLNRYDQAVENFDIALLLGQLEGHIYAERGRTYHLWGDWNCCVADYRRALTLLPEEFESTSDPAIRLRSQVETWLNQLLGS